MPRPSISTRGQSIRFQHGDRLLEERPLTALEQAHTVYCFNPEVAPTGSTSYNVLVFHDRLWIVPDESASRFIAGEWAEQLACNGGFFYAESGVLPKTWRRRFFLIAKHPYYPKAVVVPKEPLPFTRTSERIDPRYLSEYNQRYAAALLRD